MPKTINSDEVLALAERLIKRYGKNAIEMASQKADEAQLGEFPSEKDIALHVLTQVEILLDK